MITIQDFIFEKLKITKDIKIYKSQLDEYKDHKFKRWDDLIFRDIVKYLSSISDDYDVKFNRRENNAGDFHIFIYEKGKHNYKVGFDGYWENYEDLSFYNCAKMAEDWLLKHK